MFGAQTLLRTERGGVMDADKELLIKVTTSPASGSWGFVGVVKVGEHEAYRTIRASPSPGEALNETQLLLADVLGSLLARRERRSAQAEFGHAPRRIELEFGLSNGTPSSVIESKTTDPV